MRLTGTVFSRRFCLLSQGSLNHQWKWESWNWNLFVKRLTSYKTLSVDGVNKFHNILTLSIWSKVKLKNYLTKRDLPLPRCFLFVFILFSCHSLKFRSTATVESFFLFHRQNSLAGFLPRASETGDWKIEASMPTHPHIIFGCKESNQTPRLVRGKSENNKTK